MVPLLGVAIALKNSRLVIGVLASPRLDILFLEPDDRKITNKYFPPRANSEMKGRLQQREAKLSRGRVVARRGRISGESYHAIVISS